jgi:AcrR family transcriptional regulator
MNLQTPARNKRGPYSSPRQEQRQRRILDVARREIAALGYDAITMQGLANASEVSVKTLYNLYGSKDELLLAAVENLLEQLRQHPSLAEAPPGVASLLAFYDVLDNQIVATPHYAEVMAKTMFRADKDHRLTRILLGDTGNFASAALEASIDQGEVRSDIDTVAIGKLLMANAWGVILAWSKGLIPLQQFKQRALQSRLMTLVPVCQGSMKQGLENRLNELLFVT